jgi:hypothetical protein
MQNITPLVSLSAREQKLQAKREYSRAYRERNRERYRARRAVSTRTGEKLDAAFLVNECDDSLTALAVAVIWRAVDDLNFDRTPNAGEVPVNLMRDVKESARVFFAGEWFAFLADCIGFDLDQLRARVARRVSAFTPNV